MSKPRGSRRPLQQTRAQALEAWLGIPSLVRELLQNWLIGMALGLATALALLYFVIGGIGTLIHNSSDPVPPLVLLCGGFATTFGGAYAATAAMTVGGKGPLDPAD